MTEQTALTGKNNRKCNHLVASLNDVFFDKFVSFTRGVIIFPFSDLYPSGGRLMRITYRNGKMYGVINSQILNAMKKLKKRPVLFNAKPVKIKGEVCSCNQSK